MAHLAVENLLAQASREVADSRDHKETDHILREFWKATAALRNVLDQHRSLNSLGLLRLENHFHFLQMAYHRWKRNSVNR
jgi:hypothetical protein